MGRSHLLWLRGDVTCNRIFSEISVALGPKIYRREIVCVSREFQGGATLNPKKGQYPIIH